MSLRVKPPLTSSGSSRPFTLVWNHEIFLPLSWLGWRVVVLLQRDDREGRVGFVRHDGDHRNAARARLDERVRVGDAELLAARADEHLVLLAGRRRPNLQIDAFGLVDALRDAAIVLRVHRPWREVDAHHGLVLGLRGRGSHHGKRKRQRGAAGHRHFKPPLWLRRVRRRPATQTVVESLPSCFQEIIRSIQDMRVKNAVPITASAMIAAKERAPC